MSLIQKISGFIISILLFPVLCYSQDTIRYPIEPMKGIRIGVDLGQLALPIISSGEQIGFEGSADVHIKGNWFAVAEVGWLTVNLDKDEYDYQSNGFYLKAGADYNMLKSRRPHSNDLLYFGARYGFSVFSHKASDVTVPGYYWPDAPNQGIPSNTMSAHWMELLLGIKAEVLKNFYIGIIFRTKFLLVKPKDDYSTPYTIPGFGKGTKTFSLGLNYYISYNFRF